MAQHQSPLFRYERKSHDELGRRLIASADIQEGRLIFVERPFIARQTLGNMHDGVLVCNYCMAFCGSPEQALRVASDASCLQEITTNNRTCTPVSEGDGLKFNFLDNTHALYHCRHNCGHIYCSLECQQDDWEWGGHRELCTGTIPDPIGEEDGKDHVSSAIESSDESNSVIDPLLKFKIHAMQTNEIFLLVAQWLIRILKNNIPYNEDDLKNTHPYTDFQMNTWWSVKANEDAMIKMQKKSNNIIDDNKNDVDGESDAESLDIVLKRLCQESHSYLSQALESRLPETKSSPWLTPIGIARLIGSLEQNCLGIRRKHALQRVIMEDTELRHEFHTELLQCLTGAGLLGNDDSSCGCGDDEDTNIDESDDSSDSNTSDMHTSESKQPDTIDTAIDVDADESENRVEESDYMPDDIAAFLANLTQDITNNCQYDEWDEFIQPLDGVSHYSIATKMNHDCDPNVILVYKTRGWGRDHPLVAYIVALRDIAKDEELTISYISSTDSYEERQAALANYGFVCRCSMCEREKDNGVKGRQAVDVGKNSTGQDGEFGGKNNDEGDLFGDDEENLFGNDEDDLFGDDDENNLFGDDENDLFGDGEDCDGQNSDGIENDNKRIGGEDVNDENLSGDEKLSNVSERLDTILNKSNHIAIPLTFLAPVSNYIVKQVSSLLQDIRNEKIFDDNERTIQDLLGQNMNAIKDRDFASCRVVGSDLELCLFNQLESNGSWTTLLHRASYWCATITASIGYAHEGSFIVSMKYLDKAIILGQDRSVIEGYFGYVEYHASRMAAGPCPIAVKCKVTDYQDPILREGVISKALPTPIRFPVKECISHNDSDKTDILMSCDKSESLVIRLMASTWPAVKKWRNMDNLAREFGHRLVPIEVGSMSSKMVETVVPFRSFVAKYLSASAKKEYWTLDDAASDKNNHIAYLAQHPLLDQIPALYNDIDTNPCGVCPTNVNIWLGTGGTRTPLHFDSYDNLLVQLVGAKYVRLYEKECSPYLYVSKDKGLGGQGNMSELDCERENYSKYPLAKGCGYKEVVLFPGDCLFIPSRHWHYVRSLSTSVSVNYWF